MRLGALFGLLLGAFLGSFRGPFRGHFWLRSGLPFGIHFGAPFASKHKQNKAFRVFWRVLKGTHFGAPFDPIPGYLSGNNFGSFLELFLDSLFRAWPPRLTLEIGVLNFHNN